MLNMINYKDRGLIVSWEWYQKATRGFTSSNAAAYLAFLFFALDLHELGLDLYSISCSSLRSSAQQGTYMYVHVVCHRR